MPPSTRALGDVPVRGATIGRNSFGTLGWGGPCPPPGSLHHYTSAASSQCEQAQHRNRQDGAGLLALSITWVWVRVPASVWPWVPASAWLWVPASVFEQA
jgi:hypothetical protein